MKSVLITGALGQDGIILSKIYLKKKFKVFGIIKKKNKNSVLNVKYIKNNLKLKSYLTKIIIKIKPKIIVHLAASNNPYNLRKKESYNNNYLKNLEYTKNLVNSVVESRNKCRFIFAGSSLMFKKQKKIKVTEKNNFQSNGHYGKYKIESYKYLTNIFKKHGINSSTAILFNHDSVNRGKKFLIPRLIKAFIKKDKKSIEKIFALNISGDFSNAEDICDGIYKLSISSKKIDKIILSSGKRFYINQLIDYLSKKFSFKIKKGIKLKQSNHKIIGSNLLAINKIKYRNKKNIFDIIDKTILGLKKNI